MGQESSQEKAAAGSANTPTDPTRTPSGAEEADTADHMFGQIAEAMDASQNRRKSQLLQSPESNQEAKEENEGDARSPESKKKKLRDRRSGEHGDKKKKSKKVKHRKSLDVDASQLIPDVETFNTEDQPSQIQGEASKVLEPASDEEPNLSSKKHEHKKSKDSDNSYVQREPEQEDGKATEQQVQPEEPVTVASAGQHKSKSEKRRHKKSRDAESPDAAPEGESIVVEKEPAEAQQAILSPPSEEQSMQKTKKLKKEKRRVKKARQSLLDQFANGDVAAQPDEQSQMEESVLEPASPALTPAAERQEPAGEAVAAAESMDVIPESSLRTPATPSVGSKKKLKTFKSAQKKKILAEQIHEHDADAIPPTQPSQAEETQVHNSYEPKDARIPDARRSQSPRGNPALSEAEVEDKDQEVEAEEEEEPEVVVKPKESKNSKAEKKEKKQKKRRLPVDDVTDTPSKRARLDIQAPPEQEPTKAMLKKAKRKAKLAERVSGDENHEGMLSAAEWRVIDSQLEKYRGMHDLTVEEQNRIIQGPVGRRDSPTSQLFTFVMEEFHYRKRWSVIHAMRRKYHDFDKRGAWAPEDDEELMAVYARYPAQWKEIASRLNRHPDDCRDRYRYVLVCGTNIHWGRWSLDEEQLLQKVVEGLLSKIHKARQEQTAELDEEERAVFYEDAPSDMQLIDWDVVSAEMGRRRGPRQCIEKYKIIQKRTPARWAYYAKKEGKAVLQASKMTLKDKINLLKILKEAGVEVEDGIDWKDVASKLIELDSEGNISELTPKFSRKSAEKAWTKLRYLVENANSLEFQEILDTLLDKLNSSGDEDPSKSLFQARIGTLDVHVEARKDLKPAKRTKHNVIAAAAMTLEDKRHLLTKLQKSGAEKEDDIVWPQIFPNIRRGMHKFAAGWEANKLAWELLSTFLESTKEPPPAGLRDRVSLLIEMFEHHDGEDPTHQLFMELVEKKSLQGALKKFKERNSSTAKDEAVEAAAKNRIANMPASAKIMVLEALLKSGIKDEDDIVWSKHGYIPYMKKCTYNAHAQRLMLSELRSTVDKVEEYEFQDLIEYLITELSGYSKEERQRKPIGPRQAHVIKPTAGKLDPEASRRKNNWASSKLSKKVLDESDDELDEDVVESLNAANPQGEADGDSDAEIDEAGEKVTVVETPTTQSSSPAPASVEKPASPEKSISESPAEELRKDLYEFDEDELEETMLKSVMKKRKPPKKLSVPVSPETVEDNSVLEITLEVDSEPESEKEASDDEMPDAIPEVESEAEEEEDETADEQMPSMRSAAEDSFVKSLELEAEQKDHLDDEFEDSISQFAALRAQRRKDIQRARSSVVPDSEDEAPAVAEPVQPSQPPPSSPPLTLAEKKRRKKERKEKRAKRRSEIAETQEEETASAAAVEPREIVRGSEDFIPPYMDAKVQSSREGSPAAEAPVQEAPTATQVLEEEAAAEDAANEEVAPPTSPVETMSEKRKKDNTKKEERASLTAVNYKDTSPTAEAPVEDVPSATQVLKEQAEAEEALEEEVPKPSSPVEKMSEKRKTKNAKKEKRRSEVEETQENEGPSALDVLVALGSKKKPSPPKQAPEDAIPPTSSMLPTMSQVIKQSKKNKKKRHSDIAPIPEISTQEEEVEAPVVAEEAEAMVAVDADAPASPTPAPFPDVPTATQEMPPPSSIFIAPFPDIPASEDEVPVPSSVPPPSSPPLSSKQRRKLRRAAARAEDDAPVRPATPSPEEEPVSNLAKSLRKAGRGRKRGAETSVEELEAGETQEQEAPRTARKAPRVSVPPFTPRTSRRERRPTQKAMTPYK